MGVCVCDLVFFYPATCGPGGPWQRRRAFLHGHILSRIDLSWVYEVVALFTPEAAQRRKAQKRKAQGLKRKAHASCISTHICQKWLHSRFSLLILRVNWIPTFFSLVSTVVRAERAVLCIRSCFSFCLDTMHVPCNKKTS